MPHSFAWLAALLLAGCGTKQANPVAGTGGLLSTGGAISTGGQSGTGGRPASGGQVGGVGSGGSVADAAITGGVGGAGGKTGDAGAPADAPITTGGSTSKGGTGGGVNEPNANWWKSNGGQEGCHFSASNQQQMIKAVAAALTAQGVTGTRVSASDENSMDDALSIMGGYDATTLAAMVQMNVHSYAGSKRTQLRALATSKGKRLWQSESGPLSVTLASNTDAAIFMAGRIIQDLRELQPQAWIQWQVVDPAATWTSFTVNDAQETWQPVKRFYAQAGFSRYIRPGATFVDINNADMVAALAGDGSTLVLVVRNGDSAASKSFTFDRTSLTSLTSLPTLGASIDVYRTSASEDLAQLTAMAVQDWSFTATAPAYSITTFVIPLGS